MDEAKVAAFIAARNANFGDERYVDPETAVPALIEAFEVQQPEVRMQVKHGEREHIVKADETLSSIAADYGMPYGWLIIANHGISNTIYVGDRITIPSQDELLPLPAVENKRIKISITKQRVQAYENGQLKWDWAASTGLAKAPPRRACSRCKPMRSWPTRRFGICTCRGSWASISPYRARPS